MNKLWIDDIREPTPDWVWVKNALDAEREIFGSTKYDLISFDHDLGEDSRTGYDILNNLEKQIFKGGYFGKPIPELIVHSANPVGRKNMLAAIASIERLRDGYESGGF